MTTRHSPLTVLQKQADAIAATIKAAERGEKIENTRFARKVRSARETGTSFKVGIIMDDKTLVIELLWDTIAESSEAGLAQYILKLMMETRDDH